MSGSKKPPSECATTVSGPKWKVFTTFGFPPNMAPEHMTLAKADEMRAMNHSRIVGSAQERSLVCPSKPKPAKEKK